MGVPLLPLLSQRLSQRLMLIPISCTEDMALAMPDIMDMLDIHTPMDTMERDLLMLIPISMDMVLDTEPTDMDTHMPMVPMDTMERDLLMLSQRLMLMLLSSTELTDMVLDTEPTDM